MSKAEERALEAYPVKQRYNDYYGDYEDMNIVERASFQEGYEQAEKDLALTWEDMQLTWQLCDTLNSEQPNLCGSKDFFTEVLNRFNKSKEERK